MAKSWNENGKQKAFKRPEVISSKSKEVFT